ncbi:MAG TPA: hypothetical protein VJ717_04730, partial [Gemmatimonadaceae bacterium]|nr:hypothetical protein [Gemmatimonadaceae bacterium]
MSLGPDTGLTRLYQLTTLGHTRLECAIPADQRAAALLLQRPKHLALLVYLALQNGALTRRDTLLALFWPELDEAHARNTLSKTLGRIRSCLGDDVVRAIGAHEVGLQPGVVRSDVAEFRAAVAMKDW